MWKNTLVGLDVSSPLREEILAGRNIGGFGGFVKNPPKSAKGEVRSIFIFWYFILYNMKILST